jgi:hypothetical protein
LHAKNCIKKQFELKILFVREQDLLSGAFFAGQRYGTFLSS